MEKKKLIFVIYSLVLQTCYGNQKFFTRVSTFPVCKQFEPTCNTNTVTNAEIVTATADGKTLIYSAGLSNSIGFVDITVPSNPIAKGTISTEGEPTSVSALGNKYVLACINTSTNYINVSGKLIVIDIASKAIVATFELGGQPDSIKVSNDGKYAVIAVENERDESLNGGDLPQYPPGYVVVVDIDNITEDPQKTWKLTTITLAGLPGLDVPSDPEPEFVDINDDNVAAVTVQENNAIVLIDCKSKKVVRSFTAGSTSVSSVDVIYNKVIENTGTRTALREPDGVAWIDKRYFVTADEGDWKGGTRTFSIFDSNDGQVVFSSGSELELIVTRYGAYPEKRNKKGNEPENVVVATFNEEKFLFVNSERSSLVFVYKMINSTYPVFHQVLPVGTGPEGGLAIPTRGLYVVASEVDSRSTGVRSSISIYQYGSSSAKYPTLVSKDRTNIATPIPFSALSGLAAETRDSNSNKLYSIEDSFFIKSRFFTIDVSKYPAVIESETRILDSQDILINVPTNSNFDAAERSALVNSDDKTVNLDLEGIAVAADGGFWVVSEGAGTVGDASRPITSLNFLIKLSQTGVIQNVITLPDVLNDIQVRYGFEGVAEGTGGYAGNVLVIFQRAWGTEADTRLGWYNVATKTWKFFFYKLDVLPTVRNSGWVGLSDVAPICDASFLVLERDNQAGPDAQIKRLYKIDLANVAENSVVTKTLAYDLLPTLQKVSGLVPEKWEGVALNSRGDIYIVNDNDGIDGLPSEMQLTLVQKGSKGNNLKSSCKKKGKKKEKKGKKRNRRLY